MLQPLSRFGLNGAVAPSGKHDGPRPSHLRAGGRNFTTNGRGDGSIDLQPYMVAWALKAVLEGINHRKSRFTAPCRVGTICMVNAPHTKPKWADPYKKVQTRSQCRHTDMENIVDRAFQKAQRISSPCSHHLLTLRKAAECLGLTEWPTGERIWPGLIPIVQFHGG